MMLKPFKVHSPDGKSFYEGEAPFQARVRPWMMACFGAEIAADRIERNHRFFEEATELVQANGMTASEAHQLVDYVFNRPVGELHQEVGGVMVTLAALCLASGQDMHDAGETELTRIWTKVETIRAKQAGKPKHSPLPEAASGQNLTDEWRAAVATAYGYLWHVANPEPLAPDHVRVDVYRASYRARAALRDLMTHEQRGEAINVVRALLAASDKEGA